jgi:serine/threonine protein kinase
MERPTSPPPPPRLAGQYELQELLGEGALGQVYRARHQTTGRPAAVKFLKDVFGPDPIEVRRRFAREIKILARLDHPNLIRLFDADTSVEPPYLVCELVDGKNLDEFISRKSLDMAGRLALCVELAQAVAYLHHNNLIHRDIKPANVLMTAGGSAKLGDFGLARGQVSHAETRLTKSGVLVGTMLFMAPELFSSGSPSQGSDQFSLALVLALILSWNTTEHLIKLRYGPLSGESPERQLLDGVPGIPTRVKSGPPDQGITSWIRGGPSARGHGKNRSRPAARSRTPAGNQTHWPVAVDRLHWACWRILLVP